MADAMRTDHARLMPRPDELARVTDNVPERSNVHTRSVTSASRSS